MPLLPKLSLCLAALALAATAFAASTTTPAPREHEGWMKRHESFNERIRQGNVDLIMIGDSITHGWEVPGKEVWDQYYARRNAVNLGISGDRTEHVLWRLQNGNIEGISPKVASIMIGTNNVADNTPEEIAEGVTAIVKLLREKLPNTKILLLAIFPRDEQPATDKRKEINQANKLIRKAVAADGMVTFLNINKAFLDDNGVLPDAVMPDELHPNPKGYELWAAAMEPKLRELLGETDGAVALFNGASLQGWEQVGGDKPCWFADEGMLYTDGAEGGGWLSTKKEYGNFELTLEYKVPKGGNSGVFIRAPREGNPAFEGSEIQVLDDADEQYKDLQPYQYTGSVYSTCAPSKRVTKPAGEWQTMKIRAEGSHVQVWVNGEQTVDCNLEDAAKDEAKLKEHPGLKRNAGYIGLQNHSSRLDYRNVFIKEL